MIRRWQKITYGPEETEALGKAFGEELTGGAFIALRGGLGLGKTAWVRGLASGLGIKDTITSPTFTILKSYEGRLKLHHFDAYRIADPDEMIQIGCEDIFYGPDVVAVEWPGQVETLLPDLRFELLMEMGTTPEERMITLWETEAGEA
jgi:tRNA threonylcarbamoyladenosine biosynthesis protein TsaE